MEEQKHDQKQERQGKERKQERKQERQQNQDQEQQVRKMTEKIRLATGMDPLFLRVFRNIVREEKEIRDHPEDTKVLRQAKRMGFSDAAIGYFWGMQEKEIFSLKQFYFYFLLNHYHPSYPDYGGNLPKVDFENYLYHYYLYLE